MNDGLLPMTQRVASSPLETVELNLSPLSIAVVEHHTFETPDPIDTMRVVPTMLEPRTMSLPVRPPKLKVRSFVFPLPGQSVLKPPPSTAKAGTNAPASSAANAESPAKTAVDELRKFTRIKPPGDVIKLEDRLFYVLQPPLETVITGGTLEFPFHPFPYQLEGIAFLYPREAAVLADEMGLGKTMQTISAIRLLLHAGEVQSVLIVCPKPLVTNWQREFHAWAPEVPLTVIEGDAAKRRWQWELADCPVKIANYELLQRDREMIEKPDAKFDLVVLDESQRIKNRNSTTSEIVRSIQRRRSWAMTGTPVENRAEDLVGIFEFLAPGYLKPEMKPSHMGRLVSDYVIRRTKDKVLTDLPPKMFRDAEIELTPEQRSTYRTAEEEGVLRLTNLGREITIQHVFELVLRLKQICNFDPVTGESAKLERLSADLEEVADSRRKAIVFSQWTETLETLKERLGQFRPLVYHGGIPSKKRDPILQEFKESKDRPVLLISYGAGGVGLNLQFSEYVFLFDRWWNPAIEDQAVNRAHRIGAAGPVTVTRFLAVNSIEERINQILAEKREIFDSIFNDSLVGEVPQKSGLTQAEIFGLFQLKCPSGPLNLAA